MSILAVIDTSMAAVLPPLVRIGIWAILSGMVSMGIYARLSPQKRFAVIKTEQKAVRKVLMAHEGSFDELWKMIRHDLALSFKMIGLMLLPFAVSVAPVLWLMIVLIEHYAPMAPFVGFGPDWMRGFEFWYILFLLLASLSIKFKFQII